MNTRFLVILFILIILDVYVFQGFRNLSNKSWQKIGFVVFYGISIVVTYGCITLILYKFDDRPTRANPYLNFLFGYMFAFTILKMTLALFLFVDDVFRIGEYVFRNVWRVFLKTSDNVEMHSRRNFIRNIGIGVGSIPFASMLYGITKGKYNYKVKHMNLAFKNLPKAFEGFKLVHISDVHSGSFDSIEDVERGIDMIQEQNADAILFTGDLVNNEAKEIVPYKPLFEKLSAPFGKFSSLGNHDYGTHKRWNSQEEKQENMKALFQHQKDMGFDLLNNESRVLEKDGEKINIIGVENWGSGPFPKKGDLDSALEGVDSNAFKILLSHDPTHWDHKIVPHTTPFDLTLSGHTHGMQFGVEIPGFKWSPSKYVYKRWAGHYKNGNQHLYVNRGFGFLGFPGRVGIWPEITVITLGKA